MYLRKHKHAKHNRTMTWPSSSPKWSSRAGLVPKLKAGTYFLPASHTHTHSPSIPLLFCLPESQAIQPCGSFACSVHSHSLLGNSVHPHNQTKLDLKNTGSLENYLYSSAVCFQRPRCKKKNWQYDATEVSNKFFMIVVCHPLSKPAQPWLINNDETT